MMVIQIIQLLYFLTLSIFATFLYSSQMTDTQILTKWLYTLGLVTVGNMIGCIIVLLKKQIKIYEKYLIIAVVFICFCQSIYAIIQLFQFKTPPQIVGGFDNPAGLAACLSISTPYCLYLIQISKKNFHKLLSLSLFAIICTALILSGSRSGIIAGIFVPCSVWVFNKKYRKWLQWLFLCFCIVLLPIMYFIKKDSADGRLLILCSAWEMIKKHPIIGYGFNGISAHYMDFQAEWLTKNSNNNISLLADNVKHVFNDFFAICICFGIIGLIILCIFIGLMIHCYKKSPSSIGMYALVSIATVGVLGAFSYPLYYPFTWIIIAINSYILIHNAYKFRFIKKNIIKYPFIIILFCLSSIVLYRIIERISAEKEWCKIAYITSKKDTFISKYDSLMSILGNDPYFLYNYSVKLYLYEDYNRSLETALICRKYWADYDLELLLGDIYKKQHQYNNAILHYSKAQKMCPNRFIPLYKQFLIYKINCDTNNLINVGNIILTKRIKVPSKQIDNIIKDVINELIFINM